MLALAKENSKIFGVADRWTAVPGDAFQADLGKGYDLALLTNFLHHFSPVQNEALLRRVKDTLNPGGRVAVLEFVPNDDRVSPPFPAKFSMTMLATTPSGNAYTMSELESMLRNAGFGSIQRHDLLPSPQTLLVATAE